MAAPLDALIGMGLAPSPYFEALEEIKRLKAERDALREHIKLLESIRYPENWKPPTGGAP